MILGMGWEGWMGRVGRGKLRTRKKMRRKKMGLWDDVNRYSINLFLSVTLL